MHNKKTVAVAVALLLAGCAGCGSNREIAGEQGKDNQMETLYLKGLEYRAPFYLTVLVLHDIGSAAAKQELKEVAQRVRANTASKWTGEDRASRAKAKAAEILMSYR